MHSNDYPKSVFGIGPGFSDVRHGSLNWLFCRTCQRLELGATDSTKYLSIFQKIAGPDLRSSLAADGAPCGVCGRPLRPLLVAPSHLKDYRNPHLSQVWYEAQRVLRQADRAIFIGYSLPDDDVEVVYLLKRGLAHITDAKQITVVEYCKENENILLGDHSWGDATALCSVMLTGTLPVWTLG